MCSNRVLQKTACEASNSKAINQMRQEKKKKKTRANPGICKFSKAMLSLWDIIAFSSQRSGEGVKRVSDTAEGEEMGFWSSVLLWVLSQWEVMLSVLGVLYPWQALSESQGQAEFQQDSEVMWESSKCLRKAMCLVCIAVLLALPFDIFTPCTELFLLHVPSVFLWTSGNARFLLHCFRPKFLAHHSTLHIQIPGKLDLWLPCHKTTSPHLFGGAVLTSSVHGAGDKSAQGCLLCLPRWGWVAGIWRGQASASHRKRAWAVKFELLMDFASCVGSQSVARPIAESEDGKAVSMNSLSTYMSNQQLTSPPLAPNPTHPHSGMEREENQKSKIKINGSE